MLGYFDLKLLLQREQASTIPPVFLRFQVVAGAVSGDAYSLTGTGEPRWSFSISPRSTCRSVGCRHRHRGDPADFAGRHHRLWGDGRIAAWLALGLYPSVRAAGDGHLLGAGVQAGREGGRGAARAHPAQAVRRVHGGAGQQDRVFAGGATPRVNPGRSGSPAR
jgi:hypothetical protein